MRYSDVEKRLDMKLTLTMEQQHPILPLLEREIDTIPLDSQNTGNEAFVDLFICGSAAQKLEGVLSKFQPDIMGGCLVIRMKAEELGTASSILGQLGEIPLCARGSLYLMDRKIFADYRIASSDISSITEIEKRIISMNNRVRISDFGPGAGGIATIDAVNSRIPLGIVSYEADIMSDFGDALEGDCFIEYNFNQVDAKGFRAIVYNAEGQKTTYLDSPFLREVQRLSVDRKIPKAAIFARPENGKYRSFTFLPHSMVDNQVSMLYEATAKFTEAKFKLRAIRSYNSEAWQWI